MLQRWICTVVVVFFSAAVSMGDDAKDASKALQGTWKAISAENAGQSFPDDLTKSITLVIKDDKYSVTVGKQPDAGTCKVDPTKSPKAMDVTGTEGPNKGKTFLAIYELKDDTLKVCYDLSGKSRPTEFKTMPGTQLFLAVYKREKQ